VLDALEGVKLAFRIHAIAEERVLRTLARLQPVPLIHELCTASRRDHIEQEVILDMIGERGPDGDRWHEWVVALRDIVSLHDGCSEDIAMQLQTATPARLYDQLAGRYATERMRILADTRSLAFSEAC
jgi:hypothetical protein